MRCCSWVVGSAASIGEGGSMDGYGNRLLVRGVGMLDPVRLRRWGSPVAVCVYAVVLGLKPSVASWE